MAADAAASRKKFERRQPVPISTLPADLWLVQHVALALGRSESWVYKRAAEGSLPHSKRTGGLTFVPAQVMAWVNGKEPASQRPATVAPTRSSRR
ncbi:hypothetical protein ACLEPN_30695 [Myxococcus sp. 1LA]